MIDEYTKFKGTLYNVEGGPKGTGVSYKDVAGVDHALDLIKETVKMLLGGEDYVAMGTRPPRVRVTFYKTRRHCSANLTAAALQAEASDFGE